MTTERKSDTPRQMTAKGFLHKAGTKAAFAAQAFLLSHREWLTTGELAQVTSPILAKLDEKLISVPGIVPGVAAQESLQEIKTAVLNHMIQADALKAEAAMEKAQEKGVEKNHIATILDGHGVICTRTKEDGTEEDLIKGFDLPQDAMRWIDRRLFDGASDWNGNLVHTQTNQEEQIIREDSIARILKQPRGPVIKPQSKSTPRLGFGVKAKQSTASFSRG